MLLFAAWSLEPVLWSRIIVAPAPGDNFDAALALGENFDAALALAALAPAHTLLYSKAKFSKRTKVYIHIETILFI
jgi:hypothetical protein